MRYFWRTLFYVNLAFIAFWVSILCKEVSAGQTVEATVSVFCMSIQLSGLVQCFHEWNA
jgi:hypothetical protein